jgi:hypothetical protein
VVCSRNRQCAATFPTRNPTMIAFRSILFNIAFYINMIVRMIIFYRPITSSPSARRPGAFRKIGFAIQSLAAGKGHCRHHVRDRGAREHPRQAATSSRPSTSPSGMPTDLLPWLDDPVYILKRELMAGSLYSASTCFEDGDDPGGPWRQAARSWPKVLERTKKAMPQRPSADHLS